MSGSLINRMMDGGRSRIVVEPGVGATMLMWSDRHAGTIIAVERFRTGARKGEPRVIVVQRDKAVRKDENGMSDAQEYDYERDVNGRVWRFHVDSQGRFKGLAIGVRDEHYDYTF